MDKSQFEKYIEEMKMMSRKANAIPVQNTVSEPDADMSGQGFLMVNVTSVRSIYPVKNALVTIFKGDVTNMEKLFEDYTDESGKTRLFLLPAPPISTAQSADSTEIPFATYNILTQAEGFTDTINYNAAIFDKVTSIQNVNLLPRTTANKGDDTIIINEYDSYEL